MRDTNKTTKCIELTDEEQALITAYRQASEQARRNIRVLAFDRWEPAPSPAGRIIATNTARGFSDLR